MTLSLGLLISTTSCAIAIIEGLFHSFLQWLRKHHALLSVVFVLSRQHRHLPLWWPAEWSTATTQLVEMFGPPCVWRAGTSMLDMWRVGLALQAGWPTTLSGAMSELLDISLLHWASLERASSFLDNLSVYITKRIEWFRIHTFRHCIHVHEYCTYVCMCNVCIVHVYV